MKQPLKMYTTKALAGHVAVRETVELILKSKFHRNPSDHVG
jgi:hypothetical protein